MFFFAYALNVIGVKEDRADQVVGGDAAEERRRVYARLYCRAEAIER